MLAQVRAKEPALVGDRLYQAIALATVLAALGSCKGAPCKSKQIFEDLRPVEVFTGTEVDIRVSLEFKSDLALSDPFFETATINKTIEKTSASSGQNDFEVFHAMTFEPKTPPVMNLHLTRFSRISRQEIIDKPLRFHIDFNNGRSLEIGFRLASQSGLEIRDFSWKEQAQGCFD